MADGKKRERTLNILQINSSVNIGGASRVMYRLHQRFKRLGHTGHILTKSRGIREQDIHLIADVTGERRSLLGRLTAKARWYIDGWLGMPGLYRSTKRILKTKIFQQTDVVHLHNLHGRYFDYGVLPTFAALKPVVWTLHDMWALTGHCAYAYDCERWKTSCFDCPLLKGTGRYLVEPVPTLIDRTRVIWRNKQRLYRRASLHIVTPSCWLCTLAKNSILSEMASIQCIPNGVDLDVFYPRDRAMARNALDIAPDAKVILFTSASILDNRKGFTYLLKALHTIPDTSSIVLLTMGTRGSVSEEFGSFKCRELGRLNDEGLQSLAYSAADLFVLPTLADNQPLVVIESLACGTPIVSFDVGGVPEMVRHTDTGYLARYKDAQDLSRGIQMLLDDDARRAQMRHRCRKVAEQEYSLELQAKRHLALYQKAIEQHSALSSRK